jgi:hypothetical protein
VTGQMVEIRSTMTTVEIFHRGERVASHLRSPQPYQATTVHEHRPKSHQQHLAWPPSRLLHWAETLGPATAQLFTEILKSKPASKRTMPLEVLNATENLLMLKSVPLWAQVLAPRPASRFKSEPCGYIA